MKQAILIAMSGGVDSSVAAHLAVKKGYDCTGVMLKLVQQSDYCGCSDKSCCSEDDVADARAVAARLDMPFYVWDFIKPFEAQVIERFVSEYVEGRTPNPCIDCNRYIKFESMLKRAVGLGFDKMATGHYGRTYFDEASGRYLLKKAIDETKDQSYVLYNLSQEMLSRLWFPLGELRKTEVREIAEGQGFINANKCDSQDLCFVTKGCYGDFIQDYVGETPKAGDFVDHKGQVLGRHKGIVHYTIGQRRGLGIAHPHPLYVLGKDVETNQVILGAQDELKAHSFEAVHLNWIAFEKLEGPLDLSAKIRYNQKETRVRIWPLGEDRVHVECIEVQEAVAPGQSVVFYDGNLVVGGGIIV
jgi:tRNA-specific 2-thiouridylase